MPRASREETYFDLAQVWAKRSTCLRGQVGCVLVLDDRVIGAGYNGAPANMPHCTPATCGPDTGPCSNAIHAEANAIATAANYGIGTSGSHMYCTHGPCLKCAQLILAAGIKSVWYLEPYHDSSGVQLLFAAKVPNYHRGPVDD